MRYTSTSHSSTKCIHETCGPRDRTRHLPYCQPSSINSGARWSSCGATRHFPATNAISTIRAMHPLATRCGVTSGDCAKAEPPGCDRTAEETGSPRSHATTTLSSAATDRDDRRRREIPGSAPRPQAPRTPDEARTNNTTALTPTPPRGPNAPPPAAGRPDAQPPRSASGQHYAQPPTPPHARRHDRRHRHPDHSAA